MSHLEVALVHELCPICLSTVNEQILLNQKLTEKAANQVKEAHGKAIGLSDTPCESCQSQLDDGFVAFIGVDDEKSQVEDGSLTQETAYRTGHIVWIKEEICPYLFTNWKPSKLSFMSQDLLEQLENAHSANK